MINSDEFYLLKDFKFFRSLISSGLSLTNEFNFFIMATKLSGRALKVINTL
jgi:hypothetical protein